MYKCTCNLDINPDKFPNHLKSKKHKYFYQKTHHPFMINKLNKTLKETNIITVNELIK